MIRILLLTSAVVALLPSAALAGGGGGGAICSGFAESDTVRLLDSCIEGTAHFTEPGVVTVRNDGAFPHDYTAVDGTFQTGLLDPGASAPINVDEPGVYRVRCTLHSDAEGGGMAGVLVVGEPAEMALASTAVEAAERGDAGGQPVAWIALAVAAAALAVSTVQRWRASRSASASTS
jgi:hypothetical protein